MMLFSLPLGIVAALLVSLLAAVQDARTGLISNALTLPPILLSPIVIGFTSGPQEAITALGVLLICGLIPYWMFRVGAAGGGDVKLFAALGALGGLDFGLSALFLSFIAAAIFSLVRLAVAGRIKDMLTNIAKIVVNPFRKQAVKFAITPLPQTHIRMGVPIFITVCMLCFRQF